jgi:ADP-ribose diphosphatase
MDAQDKEYIIIAKETIYRGFFKLEKYRVKHTLFAGGWSPELDRELFSRGSCVAVLLYDPVADAIVLIEQFRIGAIFQTAQPWLLEIVAGAIEENETAEQVAYRETMEETGCQIQELMKIREFYTTPGAVGENITLFCGKVDASSASGIHGEQEEGEDILVSAVSFDEAYTMVEHGKIDSAISIIAIQWLALNRQRVRQQWGS